MIVPTQDELCSLGHIPGVDPSFLSPLPHPSATPTTTQAPVLVDDGASVQDIEATIGSLEVLPLTPPQSMFRSAPVHPLQLLVCGSLSTHKINVQTCVQSICVLFRRLGYCNGVCIIQCTGTPKSELFRTLFCNDKGRWGFWSRQCSQPPLFFKAKSRKLHALIYFRIVYRA